MAKKRQNTAFLDILPLFLILFCEVSVSLPFSPLQSVCML